MLLLLWFAHWMGSIIPTRAQLHCNWPTNLMYYFAQNVAKNLISGAVFQVVSLNVSGSGLSSPQPFYKSDSVVDHNHCCILLCPKDIFSWECTLETPHHRHMHTLYMKICQRPNYTLLSGFKKYTMYRTCYPCSYKGGVHASCLSCTESHHPIHRRVLSLEGSLMWTLCAAVTMHVHGNNPHSIWLL